MDYAWINICEKCNVIKRWPSYLMDHTILLLVNYLLPNSSANSWINYNRIFHDSYEVH